MDTLRAIEHLSAVLTVEEWQAFKETDDYLWMMASAEKYRGNSMDELIRRGVKRRTEAWEIALDMAKNILEREVAELAIDVPEEQMTKSRIALAEKLLIEQNLTPPTFTAWCDCDSCGRVPVPEGTPGVTPNCPWCMI